MHKLMLRQLERLLILALGISVAYIALWQLLPRLDHRLPVFFASILWYVCTVYILIPLAYRLYRVFKKPHHIPSHTSTPDGFPCDPINVALIGTRTELLDAMRAAGWKTADKRTLRTAWKLGWALLLNRSYPTAPFSTLYLFGRGQDYGFEIEVNNSVRHRHHIRFWAVNTEPTTEPKFYKHIELWRRHHYFQKYRRHSFMWVGAATLDNGFGFIRYNGQLTHSIDPNTNKERAFVATSLRKSGWVHNEKRVRAHSVLSLKNRVLGIRMEADGDILIVDLQRPSAD